MDGCARSDTLFTAIFGLDLKCLNVQCLFCVLVLGFSTNTFGSDSLCILGGEFERVY